MGVDLLQNFWIRALRLFVWRRFIVQIYEYFFLSDRTFLEIYVAVTDLFPLANQCPRQAIRSNTDQSGAERIDSSFLSRTIFSNPFWESADSQRAPS